MADLHSIALGVHALAGAIGLIAGPLVLRAEHTRPHASGIGRAYVISVLVVGASALVLVGLDPAGLWWLTPLAVLTAALALLGLAAGKERWPVWERAYAHGQGGSYIALVTAGLVVSLSGPVSLLAWVLPTVVGLPLIERRVARLRNEAGADAGLPTPTVGSTAAVPR